MAYVFILVQYLILLKFLHFKLLIHSILIQFKGQNASFQFHLKKMWSLSRYRKRFCLKLFFVMMVFSYLRFDRILMKFYLDLFWGLGFLNWLLLIEIIIHCWSLSERLVIKLNFYLGLVFLVLSCLKVMVVELEYHH